jgi:hypothetical protein
MPAIVLWWGIKRCSLHGLLETDASPAFRARGIVSDQLNAGTIKGIDHFGQRVDHASHYAVARFHALDRWQRDAGEIGKLPLVDTEKGASGSHLGGSDHVRIQAL